MPSSTNNPLTTSLTTTEADQIASLHLIADSIAQQRQLAARSMLTHPAMLSCLTFSLIITYFFTRALGTTTTTTTGEDTWPYLLLITWPACIMLYLLAAAHTTHPYLEKAGRTGTWVWLWRGGTSTPVQKDHHNAEKHEEDEKERGDIILVTKYQDRVIGTLVLRIIHTEEELWGHVRDAVLVVGVIRAWTVQQHLRGIGVGRNLLENAVRICRERGVKGPVFSDCHANEVLGLPVVCNGELVRRERWAREVLERVKSEKKNKMSTTTATATTSASTCTSTGNLYVLPVQDAACALPNTNNASAIMDKCCSPASPTKYDNDCGIYCLAQGQDVKELLSCIQSNGAVENPFCSGNLTATATASVTGTKATGSSSKTGTSTGSAASETGSSAAVPMKQVGVSKVGLGMLGMVLCGAVLGGF
ncbi:hypothetical protein BO85DRAFT_463349 [Aspergillus piperis CBS 112811]|uniref:N-acetyltransferase domain-containing protein n=1 Tax=Aspergillus piperis CBS 112811 TaxID=1448313 RepID=A0A8G1QUI2_9EURO|nr:hypothetical protein BO85DRAFT_463349 [Aspergillus piperis CBS 112811]RAH53097.1 hypothetical protein BO85DRAFT_463349 [Aspergillus piperis CBS 112811]